MSVHLSVRKPHGRTSLFVHVAYGPGSVLLWRRCDMLGTFGFVDDVKFSRNNSMAGHVYSKVAVEHHNHNCRDSNQILLNHKD